MTNVMPIPVYTGANTFERIVMLICAIAFILTLIYGLMYEEGTKGIVICISVLVISLVVGVTTFCISLNNESVDSAKIEQYYGISNFEMGESGFFGNNEYKEGDVDVTQTGIQKAQFVDKQGNIRTGKLLIERGKLKLLVKSGDQYKPYNVVKK